jgi:hypothetical protein
LIIFLLSVSLTESFRKVNQQIYRKYGITCYFSTKVFQFSIIESSIIILVTTLLVRVCFSFNKLYVHIHNNQIHTNILTS